MLSVVLDYQNKYQKAVLHETTGSPLSAEFQQIHLLLHSKHGRDADPTKCKDIYCKLFGINPNVARASVVNAVYQRNLQTLLVNAKQLNKRLHEVVHEKESHHSTIKVQFETAQRNHQTLEAGALQLELIATQKSIELLRGNLVMEGLPFHIERAMVDGSFMLIRDMIYDIAMKRFYPFLNSGVGVKKIRETLCSSQTIRQMIDACKDNAGTLPEIAKEVDELEAYAVEMMNRVCLAHAGDKWEVSSTGIVAKAVKELLASVLTDDSTQKALISCLIKSSLIPQEELDAIKWTAIHNYLSQEKLESAKTILSFGFISEEAEQTVLANKFIQALNEGNLNLAKAIVSLGLQINSVSTTALRRVFVDLVKFNNVELLRYVYVLLGTDCDQKLISEGMKAAKQGNHAEAVAFLQEHTTSRCVIS